MKKKFKIIRIVVGLVAAIVWYICDTKGGDAVVQEVAGLLAILCLFGKLIWKYLFLSKSDDKSSSPTKKSPIHASPSSTSSQVKIEPYYSDLKRVWLWDGKELRPYFPDLKRTWLWDGKELRPYFPDLKRSWLWDGKELRPYFPDLKRSWKVSGDIPIPVLAKAVGII